MTPCNFRLHLQNTYIFSTSILLKNKQKQKNPSSFKLEGTSEVI